MSKRKYNQPSRVVQFATCPRCHRCDTIDNIAAGRDLGCRRAAATSYADEIAYLRREADDQEYIWAKEDEQ